MSEMTLKEIDDEIFKLQTMRRELEKEEREKHKEAARKFVGKCYKYKDSILKVIDVPRTLLTMVGEDYNEYQFPAVFLQYPKSPRNEYIRDDLDDFAPCYCDNIYIDIKRGMPGCPALGECGQYQEISQEKFNAEFDKCIEYFKERIGVSKPKPMTTDEFITKYCNGCGSQRCMGPHDELFAEGCSHYRRHMMNKEM